MSDRSTSMIGRLRIGFFHIMWFIRKVCRFASHASVRGRATYAVVIGRVKAIRPRLFVIAFLRELVLFAGQGCSSTQKSVGERAGSGVSTSVCFDRKMTRMS